MIRVLAREREDTGALRAVAEAAGARARLVPRAAVLI